MQVKLSCSFYPFQSSQTLVFFFLFFFLPMVFWNLSGDLDFHKSSLVCGCLSKTVFFRGSQTIARSGWSQFMGLCRSTARIEVCMPITYCMDG